MAVYTVLDKQNIKNILREYDLGELIRFAPISSGIENTNYFIWIKKQEIISEYVLTIFENISADSLPFFNDLTTFLAAKGFSVPAPLKNKHGSAVFLLLLDKIDLFSTKSEIQKFGLIVPKFEGEAVGYPTITDCQKIATYIAKMHSALVDFELEKESDHSIVWFQENISMLSDKVDKEEVALLRLVLERYKKYDVLIRQCSLGVVHGDLFRDNVLFQSGEISGVIDFYHAGKTASLFDLAVVANDWAINYEMVPDIFGSQAFSFSDALIDQIYNEEKLSALIQTYSSIKALTDSEQKAWPRLLELAAFRFWISRLKTKYLTGYQNDVETGEVIKSPLAMQLILMAAMRR